MSGERQSFIMDLLLRDQRIWIHDVADKLQQPVETIKQDLIQMEQQRLLKRTFGGAVPLYAPRPAPTSSDRTGEATRTNQAIAQRAATLIRDHDIVYIGSTVFHHLLAQSLPESVPITVITNSLKVANTLKDNPDIDTYLLGGQIKSTGMVVDSYAIDQLKRFCIDKCFIAGGGFSANGITMSSPSLAAYTSALINVSRKAIGMAPHYRIGTETFVKAEPIEALQQLITDELGDSDKLREIESKGVEILFAL